MMESTSSRGSGLANVTVASENPFYSRNALAATTATGLANATISTLEDFRRNGAVRSRSEAYFDALQHRGTCRTRVFGWKEPQMAVFCWIAFALRGWVKHALSRSSRHPAKRYWTR